MILSSNTNPDKLMELKQFTLKNGWISFTWGVFANGNSKFFDVNIKEFTPVLECQLQGLNRDSMLIKFKLLSPFFQNEFVVKTCSTNRKKETSSLLQRNSAGDSLCLKQENKGGQGASGKSSIPAISHRYSTRRSTQTNISSADL